MADWVTDFYNEVMGTGPVATPGMDGMSPQYVSDFYNAVGTPDPPHPVTKRVVQSVRINPFTGQPYGAAPAQSAPSTVAEALQPPVAEPDGFTVHDKDQSRMEVTDPRLFFAGEPAAAPQTPAVEAAARLASVPLPRPRPDGIMVPRGADPGMGGLTGNMRMSPMIPAQVPPPGMAPTQWAGENITVRGGNRQPVMRAPVPATRRAASNGYIYEGDGRGGYVRVGTNRPAGVTPQQDYDRRAAAARASSPDNGGNPSWW